MTSIPKPTLCNVVPCMRYRDAPAAIKWLSDIWASKQPGPEERQALIQEARLWSRLRHPRVLPFYGISLDSDPPFLVMALMPGGDLSKFALSKPELHLRLLLDTAQGMAYLHSVKVAHGALQTNKVLIDEHGRAQVGGFGQACDFSRPGELEGSYRLSDYGNAR